MWIELEDGRLLNAEMVTDVLFYHHGPKAGTAIASCAGVVIACESKAVYDYFKTVQAGPLTFKPPDEPAIAPIEPEQPAKAQPGQE